MRNRKDTAVSFLQAAASGHARDASAGRVTSAFRHHNPHFAGDANSLLSAMDENARANPGKRLEIHHALEDGDLVAVHSHVQHGPDDQGAALVHLFRFEGDRIAELWDIAQEVPAESPNKFGMF
jgi:predicted SnoaL-like aldol condensation-catalyzing enzyme